MENFLNREFDEFLSFYHSKTIEIDLKPPSLELEQLEALGNFKTKNIGELGNFIMPNIELSRNNSLVQSESIKKLQAVKISYKDIELRKLNVRPCPYEFRLTSILKELPKIPHRDIPSFARPIPNYNNFELYTPIMDFRYLKNPSTSSRRFQIISLEEPSITRKAFWIDLYTVPLNPISPSVMKEIGRNDLSTIILLPLHKSLERLSEVSFEPIDAIEFECKPTESHVNVFEKKCVVNSGSLMDDVLIELLQFRNWKIFERVDAFKGLQVIQVSKDRVIVLIQIASIQSKLSIMKQYKDMTVILEIKNQK